jgi:hypothetical protein
VHGPPRGGGRVWVIVSSCALVSELLLTGTLRHVNLLGILYVFVAKNLESPLASKLPGPAGGTWLTRRRMCGNTSSR